MQWANLLHSVSELSAQTQLVVFSTRPCGAERLMGPVSLIMAAIKYVCGWQMFVVGHLNPAHMSIKSDICTTERKYNSFTKTHTEWRWCPDVISDHREVWWREDVTTWCISDSVSSALLHFNERSFLFVLIFDLPNGFQVWHRYYKQPTLLQANHRPLCNVTDEL